MGSIILSAEARRLIVECLDSELEHIGDMIREMPDATDDDRDAIRRERIREERIGAIREELAADV